jgi:thioredoxin-related protein
MLSVAAASLFCITSTSAAGEGWTSDYEAALKQASDEKKNLLIDFTGSDWCGWCIKLDKEVFSHDEFKTGVKDTLVLLELDFPRDKSKLTESVIAQNDTLRKKYAIKGYPTILITDEKGKPFARTGYQAGGPEKYVAHLNELIALRAKRDEAFAEAHKAEGVAKAKALLAALQSIGLDDEMIAESYADEIAAIKAADPADESGFMKGLEAKKNFAKFQGELNALGSKKDFEGALKLTEETLADGGFQGDYLIQATMIKSMIQMQLGKKDEALKTLDEAKAIDPASRLNAQIDTIRKRLEAVEEKNDAE